MKKQLAQSSNRIPIKLHLLKLQVLEELVAKQKAVSSLRTSIQALQAEKLEVNKELERVGVINSSNSQMHNEHILLSRELDVLHQQMELETIDCRPGELASIIPVGQESTETVQTAEITSSVHSPISSPEKNRSLSIIPLNSVARRSRRRTKNRYRSRSTTSYQHYHSVEGVLSNLFEDDALW